MGRTGRHQTYQVLGGSLFASYRGSWRHAGPNHPNRIVIQFNG